MLKNIIVLIVGLVFMSGCVIKSETLLSQGKNKVTIDKSLKQKDGIGTIESFVGTYKGMIKDGLPHGKGSYTWKSGESYQGQYVDGEKEGQGLFTWKDGSYYEGSFYQGKRFGKGIQSLKGVYKLSGRFSRNACHKCQYESTKLSDIRTITGSFTLDDALIKPLFVNIIYSDGSTYKGEVTPDFKPYGNVVITQAHKEKNRH